jgi:hypothetical protein
MHKALQSTKTGYNYLGFISHSLLKTVKHKYHHNHTPMT